jgi:CHAT domain-containing protein
LLASKRLDAYLSVLKWGLELASVPVAPELVDFLAEMARRRADPTELPGLEAMMPDSAVVQWLNSGSEPIPGQLRVVAGDIEGDSLSSWVKTLLSDAFYWTDNDLVVQTRSMYGGTQREHAGASFVLDRGGKVTHFNYFSNERSVKAIASGLTDDQPADFRAIGPLSWAGKDASGTRAARAVARSRGTDGAGLKASDKPAVIVLPGILGSNLKLDDKRIWLGLRFINGLKGLAWNPATADHVTPDGPIGSVYDDLIERLADSHEVIPFAYDWRRPIEDEARRLAEQVDAALRAREASRQPVRLLAHSLGGVVARTMQLEKPEVWRRMMAREGARLLMLGTPNGGSWAPMQVLSGDDTFGNALVFFGGLFDDQGARKVMAGMPGFIQLQAGLLDPVLQLDQAATWQRLADEDIKRLQERSFWHSDDRQIAVYRWGAPPQNVLDMAAALRRRLDAQVVALEADTQNMLLVVGHARFTPSGISMGGDGLEYLDAPDSGDGRVTLESAQLPGVRTWKVDAAHGDLPKESGAFSAYIELIEKGSTSLLPMVRPASDGVRGRAAAGAGKNIASGPALVRSRPSRGMGSSLPPSTEADIFGAAPRHVKGGRRARGSQPLLRVLVMNGDLKFVQQPLLVGHYRSLALSGTEALVDGLIGKSMSVSLAAGLYPDATGSHQIFVNLRHDPDNPFAMPRPQAVIVAGLGAEGKLRPSELVHAVRQAVLGYAQRVAEHPGGGPSNFELAAALIGSGGTGIAAGSSAQLIVQGVCEANHHLQDNGWPTLSRLIFIEWYLDRASDAWRALQIQADATPGLLEVEGQVQSGTGGLRQALDSGYRGASYDLISAVTGSNDNKQPTISYILDTRRARTEVRAQQAQGPLLRELIASASNDGNRDAQIGRTLFKLLVPVEMELFLSGTTDMLIELDDGTAAIPWELLDTDNPGIAGGDPRPWAIRSKLLRKLRTENFRAQVLDASAEDHVLVIGEPMCDDPRYPALPAARAEAEAVAGRFSGPSGVGAEKVCSLTSGTDDARSVTNALYKRRYRVVHVAGHGEPGPLGGVVLSGKTFLGANEVKAMRALPELVFLNCCHLAGHASSTALARYDRVKFAANIADALIEAGVRCVVAAGWAVEDGPAEIFATTFYDSLLRGERFIEAVAVARNAAWRANPQGNTWGAYQCYGDPDWTWASEAMDAQRPRTPLGDEFAGVCSPVSLILALENLSILSKFGGAAPDAQLDKIRYLEGRFARLWGGIGAVAEAFGVAHAAALDIDKAIAWYTGAMEAGDGSASFKAAEQLFNLLARRGEKGADPAQARREITDAIKRLQALSDMKTTAERESLLGSAWKLLMMVENRARRRAAELQALKAVARHYAAAEALEIAAGSNQVFYPAMNGIAAELRLAFLQRRAPVLADARVAIVGDSLQAAATANPDFWCVAGQTELRMLQALARRELAGALRSLLDDFQDLRLRVPAPWMWDSVHKQARFTLEPYQAVAGTAERRAAVELLKVLKAMAAT